MNHDAFNELLESTREAGKIVRGERKAKRIFSYSPLDVKSIRKNLGLSQERFSQLIHVSSRTLQNWEQGRRQPVGPALVLLKALKEDPKHVIAALN